MNILEQLKQWRGQKSTAHPNPETNTLRQALDAGQRAKRAEDYPRALEALETAMSVAHTAHDSTAIAVIALNQAEVYIQMEQWDQAEAVLQRTYDNAKATGQKTQVAYLLSALGWLAQSQDDWAGAARYYEQALETAREGRAVGAEGRALGFLADTYLHDANASYAIHLFRDALPKLNMTGDIELSSYFVGRLGEALIAAGNEGEGGQLLERAQRLARQMGYRRYERLWSVALGERALAEGRFADAYAHYSNVYKLSDKVRPTLQSAEVLCQLSKISLRLREYPEALEYASLAIDMSDKLENVALSTRAKGSMGMALVADHRPSEAIPYLEAAAHEYALHKTEVSEIDILRNLAAAQADSGAEEQAIETYKQATQRAESGDIRLELAQTRRDLGLLYARRHKMHDAIREWSTAIAIYDAEHQPAQVARLLCDVAAARKYLGQGQRAMKDYEQALITLNTINDDWETRGLVLSNAANTYGDQGDIESADAFFNESIAIARRIGNDTAEATRRGNYGWFLLVTGKPQQAISALEYALRLSKNLQLTLQSAIQTDNLGLVHDTLGNYPKALDYHRQALEMLEPLENSHWQHSFKINQANTLLSLGDVQNAMPLLEAALAEGRSTEDVELVIRSLIGLARVSLLRAQPQDVPPLLDEAVSLARKADMRRLWADALSIYSEQQALLHHPDRAVSLWEEARKIYHGLHHPQAKLQPAWLENQPTVSPS